MKKKHSTGNPRNTHPLSQDQIIKDLIRDYPVDALEFFKPELIAQYGIPLKTDILFQEVKKKKHSDGALKHDITVKYTFATGNIAVLVLVEHWSDKSKFDPYRFARYVIDIAGLYPNQDILPIGLFTDKADTWRKKPNVHIRVACMDEVFLEFHCMIVRMKDYQAEAYRNTKNKFLAVLGSAMRCKPGKKVLLTIEFLKNYRYTEPNKLLFQKHAEAIEYFFRLSLEERHKLRETLAKEEGPDMVIREMINESVEKGLKQGIEQGIEQGAKQAKLEDAQRMVERGLDTDLIIDITGLSSEEIEALRV